MYYKGVNRGAVLTPPGRYSIALVFSLGLLAIGSGYNGIFLAFSLGISILIISGILSERIIKNYGIEKIEKLVAEPLTPFSISITAKNFGETETIYGMENHLLTEFPLLGRWTLNVPSLAVAKVISLAPGETQKIAASFKGLPRGFYSQFIFLQRTLYPFGLLAKFKFSTVPAEVSIPPRYDAEFASQIRKQILDRIIAEDADREFCFHRSYTKQDSLHSVDWKKSAGRPEDQWVVKVFESQSQEWAVVLLPAWDELISLNSSAAYENFLSHIRTAFLVVQSLGRGAFLELPNKSYLGETERVERLLIDLPVFEQKRTRKIPSGESLRRGSYLCVRVSAAGVTLERVMVERGQ